MCTNFATCTAPFPWSFPSNNTNVLTIIRMKKYINDCPEILVMDTLHWFKREGGGTTPSLFTKFFLYPWIFLTVHVVLYLSKVNWLFCFPTWSNIGCRVIKGAIYKLLWCKLVICVLLSYCEGYICVPYITIGKCLFIYKRGSYSTDRRVSVS